LESLTGREISHYTVLELLGMGEMGVVCPALDTKLNRNVAIKLLSGEAVNDPEKLGRFDQEAQAPSALNHPNIVRIYEISVTHDG
jgi:serine/threonine protein kinase